MSEPEKKGLVPTLRFPEFRDKGEWEEKPLAKVCDVLNGRRMPISSDNREKGTYPYYGASGVVDYVKDFIFDERLLLVGEDGAKWGAFEKTAFIADGKYWVNNHAHVLRATAISDTLLENYLTMLDLAPFVTGAAPPKLTLGKLKEIPIPIPPTDREQQKIADCLTSIDALITNQTQKLDALKTHKKGLMQQLFPAEGETVPKLRFPEFRGKGGWEAKPFGMVATFSKGKGISKADISPNGKQPCIRYGELYTHYGETIETVKSHTDVPADELVLSEENDVIIPASGETEEDIATASCVLNSGIALGGDLIIIRSNLNGVFLSYFLNNAKKKEIAQLAQGISVVHLYPSQLQRLNINVPCLSEQQIIANCLSSIDVLITTQTQKNDALKAHKKGLMQQLFPAMNEVGA